MNIEYGARTLETLAKKGLIKAPIGLTTFSLNRLPNLAEIFGDDSFTAYIGLRHQGWMNGSLAEACTIAQMWLEGERHKRLIFKRYNLRHDDMPEFIDYVRKQLTNWAGPPRDNSLCGVVYRTWPPEDTLQTYIIQSEETPEGFRFVLQLDNGNPDGWKFQPKIHLAGPKRVFTDPLHREIVQQVETIHSFVSQEIKLLIVEGRVMPSSYAQPGPMATDAYEAYHRPLGTPLTHGQLQKAFLDS